MKKIILLVITFLWTQNSFCQNSFSENDIQKKTYNNEEVQVKAEFPSGEKKFSEFVSESLKKSFDKDLGNEVLISFIVEIDGSLSNIEIIKDTGNNTRDEIKKILTISPKWLPGEHEGYRVKTKVKVNLKL